MSVSSMKATGDTAFVASAVTSTVAVVFQWLPTVFAVLTSLATFLWACFRLYEMQTTQQLIARFRKKK